MSTIFSGTMSCGELANQRVEDQQGDGTDTDALADFGQMFVHGVDTDCRHDQGGAGAAPGQMAPNR